MHVDNGTVDENSTSAEVTNLQAQKYPVKFTGSGGEYFKIWIVNILLSIITLYIYSAWAKVRTKRYFYGNTIVDNSSFEYHAKPLQILYGRIIAVVALVLINLGGYIHPAIAGIALLITILALPWVVWRSLKFNARMSSYRNVRFGFDGLAGRIYFIMLGVMVGLPLLIIAVIGGIVALSFYMGSPRFATGLLTLGIIGIYALYPYFMKLLTQYSLNFHRYGTAKFAAPITTGKFYSIYLKAFGLSLLLYALIAIVVFVIARIVMSSGGFDMESLQNLEPTQFGGIGGYITIALLYLALIFIGVLLYAYVRSRLRNYRFNSTTVGGRVKLESSLSATSLTGVMMGNLLIMIFTLGLGYPWTKVRLARYEASQTLVHSTGPLDQFAAKEESNVSSLSDELGEAL